MSGGRVMRNPRTHADPEYPWLFICLTCKSSDDDAPWMLAAMMGGRGTWKAPDWCTAQDFAVAHAADHDATRCPECHQFPADRSLPKWTCGLCGETTLLVLPGGKRVPEWEANLLHHCPVRAGDAPPPGRDYVARPARYDHEARVWRDADTGEVALSEPDPGWLAGGEN